MLGARSVGVTMAVLFGSLALSACILKADGFTGGAPAADGGNGGVAHADGSSSSGDAASLVGPDIDGGTSGGTADSGAKRGAERARER